MLSLIFLSHASDVLENAFAPLNDDDYDLAMKHVRFLLDSDLETEAARQGANEVMWAVLQHLSNSFAFFSKFDFTVLLVFVFVCDGNHKFFFLVNSFFVSFRFSTNFSYKSS